MYYKIKKFQNQLSKHDIGMCNNSIICGRLGMFSSQYMVYSMSVIINFSLEDIIEG
jgi:hypothetical protein